jgi:hypothetical protein
MVAWLQGDHPDVVFLQDAHQVGVAAADHRPDQHQVRLEGQQPFGIVGKLDHRTTGELGVAGTAGNDFFLEAEFEQVGGVGRIQGDDPLKGLGEDHCPFVAVGDRGRSGKRGEQENETGDEETMGIRGSVTI